MGYLISSDGQSLLDIGDVAHSAIVSLKDPQWTMGFDADPAAGRATRLRELARLAADHQLIFAPHFPFPGVGHVARSGSGYQFEPQPASSSGGE
jgi:hypothetical protein